MPPSAVVLRHPAADRQRASVPVPFRVLVAPSGFKECMLPREVADCMAAGVARAAPDAEVLRAPIIDGGEGFTEDMVAAFGGTIVPVAVTGPLGEPIVASLGLLGGRRRGTAVLSVASAAGLRLVPHAARDPLSTTSFGVGELIRAALDHGARRILVGCGDSGVHDGGAGLATALGARLLDAGGRPIGRGGGALADLSMIEPAGLDPRLSRTTIHAFVNPRVRLLGAAGVTRLYARQKGADDAAVVRLEAGLARFAAVVARDRGLAVATRAGAGASGGIGAGLLAFCGARLVSREALIDRLSPLPGMLARADLVITGEGCLDARSADGKAPAAVALRAKRHGLPVIAIAGTIGPGAERVLAHGIDAYFAILDRPCTLADAIADAPRLLTEATAQAVRMALAGGRIARRIVAVH